MDRHSNGHGPRCIICRKFFTPNPRLGDRQKCCGDQACRRQYKNQWQCHKYGSDPQFRKAVKLRVRRHRWNRRGKETGKSPSDDPAPAEIRNISIALAQLEATVSGLAAHTLPCHNHEELRRILAGCTENGRQILSLAQTP